MRKEQERERPFTDHRILILRRSYFAFEKVLRFLYTPTIRVVVRFSPSQITALLLLTAPGVPPFTPAFFFVGVTHFHVYSEVDGHARCSRVRS